ncbi:biotin-independent malonate decarboxylase subunit beta, partial [Mesorhizobium sp. M2D.F.Ca.ET.160.01.1.1]
DTIAAFAQAAANALQHDTSSSDTDTALSALQARHAALKARVQAWGDCRDGLEIWARQGIAEPERLPVLDTDAFLAATAGRSLP